ncbi:MAG TPA: alkaline phosphatase family protein [Acidimicrobiales bacterium]|jgi:phospholipase C|nr:alkaline phosphatase family protein [Acidimicrobiales bacterium]
MKALSVRRPIPKRLGRAAVAAAAVLAALPAVAGSSATAAPLAAASPTTATPIQHLVVIFQENVSFDHYFGTYPCATNPSGEPAFTPAAGTPVPTNYLAPGSTASCASSDFNSTLLTANPNGTNPVRLDRTSTDVMTCSQNHSYTPEQNAFDHGAMDMFPTQVGSAGTGATGRVCKPTDNVDYYDGNTVTAYWNYAQHYAMSDNSYDTNFGPSTVGALNVTSGDTNGVAKTATVTAPGGNVVSDGKGGQSVIGDLRPYYDDCTLPSQAAVSMGGQNIGDLFNAAGLSWGWFQGGYTPSSGGGSTSYTASTYDPRATNASRAVCNTGHQEGTAVLAQNLPGGTVSPPQTADYIMHHEPFNFYASTANPAHIAPTSLSAIGTDTSDPGTFDKANHQYDMSQFDSLVSAIAQGTQPASQLPALSYLKAPAYEDGHAGYSDPLDEQNFVVREINALMQTPDWSSTAVVLAYDDSDGWYDHVDGNNIIGGGSPHNPSQTAADTLTAAGQCGTGTPLSGEQGRCSYGPRLPLMVVSPCAKSNFIDHTFTDQSSVVKFAEDNWLQSKRITDSMDSSAGSLNSMFDFSNCTNPATFLDPATGVVTSTPIPQVPESHFPVLMVLSAGILMLFAVGLVTLRRRHAEAA